MWKSGQLARLCTLAALALAAACSDPMGPPGLPDVTEYAPLPIYAQWWREVGECSGVQGSAQSALVRSYWVHAGNDDFTLEGETGWGMYRYPAGQIIVGAFWVNREFTIKHEQLHAKLAERGILGHTPESDPYFERCNLLVYHGT